MTPWLEMSITFANQRSYLDDLFRVYPTIPEGIRDIDGMIWEEVVSAFNDRNNTALIESLLKLELFTIKDAYVAYLKRNKSALERNPATVARLSGRVYELGLDKIFERSSEPKETNRQMGPHFQRWLAKKSLGLEPVALDEFTTTEENAVLDASDTEKQNYAKENLGYTLDKGLDLVARFNGKYVIGEAKFLTYFGGHQNAQFNDGIAALALPNLKSIPVSILDGVLYIKGRNKMHRQVTNDLKEQNIMSSLVLREFLYQV